MLKQNSSPTLERGKQKWTQAGSKVNQNWCTLCIFVHRFWRFRCNSSGLLTNKIAFDVKTYRIVFFFVLQIFNGPGLALETRGREKFKINTRVGENCLFSGALTSSVGFFLSTRWWECFVLTPLRPKWSRIWQSKCFSSVKDTFPSLNVFSKICSSATNKIEKINKSTREWRLTRKIVKFGSLSELSSLQLRCGVVKQKTRAASDVVNRN